MADATDVRLLLLDRDGSAGEARVATLPVTLGRDPDQVDVVVGERMVSRRHARLEADGDTVVVVDLGSANGTWIGDEQVDRRELVPGEVLTLGVASVLWSRVVPVAPTPELGRAWVVVVGERGLRTVLLSELYEVWARAARRVDALLAGTPAEMTAGLDTLADDHLAVLASWTVAACSPGTDPVAHRSGAPRSVGRGTPGPPWPRTIGRCAGSRPPCGRARSPSPVTAPRRSTRAGRRCCAPCGPRWTPSPGGTGAVRCPTRPPPTRRRCRDRPEQAGALRCASTR